MQGQDRVSLDSDPALWPIPTPLSIRNAPSVCVRYGLGLINFNSGRDSGVHRLPNQDKHDCYTQPPSSTRGTTTRSCAGRRSNAAVGRAAAIQGPLRRRAEARLRRAAGAVSRLRRCLLRVVTAEWLRCGACRDASLKRWQHGCWMASHATAGPATACRGGLQIRMATRAPCVG